ncbi:hypothetical protein GOM49_17185 [Clostridium bovifaecis]|uniref:SGNH hydrolase-type esterase domain-containing protein n=1 Tax=Clostridium bovifaecis TaxID=2184719 RepID=A0A6I6EWA4_9CLOT|nr:hypothetical protein GOM49_17185 [Clostridium bovifaecis]
MKIICIGDSLTYGYRVNNENRWTYLCQHHYGGINFINKGKLGDTTAGMIYRFHEDVILERPGTTIIMGGTNDFLMNSSLENVIDNIATMAKDGKQSNINIVLGIQPPVIPSLAETLWASQVNYEKINNKIKLYREWALNFSKETCISYIDFYKKISQELNNIDVKKLYIDGIHLTSEGHKLMAETALDTLDILS